MPITVPSFSGSEDAAASDARRKINSERAHRWSSMKMNRRVKHSASMNVCTFGDAGGDLSIRDSCLLPCACRSSSWRRCFSKRLAVQSPLFFQMISSLRHLRSGGGRDGRRRRALREVRGSVGESEGCDLVRRLERRGVRCVLLQRRLLFRQK